MKIPNIDEALRSRLSSSNKRTRLCAWDKFYPKHRDLWFFSFQSETGGDEMSADDLTHDMYLKMRERLDDPIKNEGIPNFIHRAAENITHDYWRGPSRSKRIQITDTEVSTEIPVQEDDRHVELEAELQHDTKLIIDAYLRRPDPIDRVIMSLMANNFSPIQIASVMPFATSTINHRLQSVTSQIRQILIHERTTTNHSNDVLSHEDRAWLRDNQGYPGLTVVNIPLTRFAHETQQELCRRFEVSSLDELNERYMPFMVVHEVASLRVEPRICVAPRTNILSHTVEGETCHYFDFMPVFDPGETRGKKSGTVYMRNPREYSAHVISSQTREDSLEENDWLYNLSGSSVTVRKVMTLERLALYTNPQNKQLGIFPFRAYPNFKTDHPLPTTES
jgi:DNA-directed RNA polymerase specialized sigma24 family protein